MSEQERFEDTLRETLRGPTYSDPAARVDVDDFLSQVHRGARRRRTRHIVGVGAAAAVVVAAGGVAVTSAGLFRGPANAPIAGKTTGTTGLPTTGFTSPSGSPSALPPTRPPASANGPVTMSKGLLVDPSVVRPISFTATGTKHQWVLASTPGGTNCTTTQCATLFSTSDAGQAWTQLGSAPAPPSTDQSVTYRRTVSQVRFAGDGRNGWMFGGSSWSTHDGGRTWSNETPAHGSVTLLEAWGSKGYVFRAVASSTPGSDISWLERSPVGTDDWTRVSTGRPVTSITQLAVAQGIAAVIVTDDNHLAPVVRVSTDGSTGSWHQVSACPASRVPTQLSTAAGYLWVVCASQQSSSAVASYTSDDGRTWTSTHYPFGLQDLLAARSNDALVAHESAGAHTVSLQRVSSTRPPKQLATASLGPVDFFGFTNTQTGYLLSSGGQMLRTADGGATWQKYVVQNLS